MCYTDFWRRAHGFRVKNSLGHAITYSQHNGRGQPSRIVGVNGEALEYDYDARGRLRLVRSFRNGGIQSTQYTYAASGLLDAVTTPDGVTESYAYDTARRLKTVSYTLAPTSNRISAISGGLDRGYPIAATGLRAEKAVNGATTRFV